MKRISLTASLLCFGWLCVNLARFEPGAVADGPRIGERASHQADLAADVHRVYSQLRRAADDPGTVVTEHGADQSHQPADPLSNAPVKKIDLAMAKSFALFGLEVGSWRWDFSPARARPRAEEVPVPPPRFVV